MTANTDRACTKWCCGSNSHGGWSDADGITGPRTYEMITSGAPVPPPQPPQPAAAAPAGDRDCLDFASQAEAQAYFESRGGNATNNVDGLDRDGDAIACEEPG
jgi:Excalibur calcium-binding domain